MIDRNQARGPDAPTLVVLTNGRASLLQKQVEYLRSFPGPILILDASASPSPPTTDHPDLRYMHRPGEPYWIRTAAAVAEVTTHAFALCADDDYFDLGFLQDAAARLAADPGVSRVYGITVGFQRVDPRRIGVDMGCTPTQGTAIGVGEGPYLDYFTTFRPQTFYGVTRTAIGRFVLDLLAPTPDGCFQFAETMWCATPLLFGRIDHLPRLMNVRSVEPCGPDYRWTYAGFASTSPSDVTWIADVEERIVALISTGILDLAHARLLRVGAASTFARLHKSAVGRHRKSSLLRIVRGRLGQALGRRCAGDVGIDPALRDAALAVLGNAGYNIRSSSLKAMQ